MAIWDGFLDKISKAIAARVVSATAVQPIIEARAYRMGYYRPQLRVKTGSFDDNIGVNLPGLLVNRIVSQMLGAGFTLDFEGDTETEQERYINAVLEANKQEVLFHRCAMSAAEAGTGYLLLNMAGVVGKDGRTYPRLQLIDPALVKIETLPEDYEIVVRYVIEYRYTGADDKPHTRRRTIEHIPPDVDETGAQSGGNTWMVLDEEQAVNGRWVVIGRMPWPYDFAPVLHWQNLPAAHDCYGEPDLPANQIDVADRYNFIASNNSKIIRIFAHPMRFALNASMGDTADVGPDKMLKIDGDNADIRQLPALGDLASSMAYETAMRQAFFSVGRVVDIDSIHDKLGALTNFGLRVLYADNLALIATHRELFGDMLEELARRLLILAGMEPTPCSVVWPDFLPVDEVERMTAIQTKIDLGLMSKQTGAGLLDLDWEQESERIEDERQASDNIGSFLLRQQAQGAGGGFFGQAQGMNGNGGSPANRQPIQPPA